MRPADLDASQPRGGQDRRIVALDGLRGAATIMVVLSHFFGEVTNGVQAMMFGWVAVLMFFVLSGYLIGKLIIEKRDCANFFEVFYVRRCARILPPYIITVLVVGLVIAFVDHPWTDADHQFPLWSYMTFNQGLHMVATDTVGAHWLAPTWTLAVEEHFYLIAPVTLVFAPRRWIVPGLLAIIAATLMFRIGVYYFGVGSEMLALATILGRADALAIGLLGAVAVTTQNFPWPRFDAALRVIPLVGLVAACGLKLFDDRLFGALGPLAVSAACLAFILAVVRGAPEARRFRSKTLRWFGDNSYCIYLTHLMVLGLAHGLILGARPDIGGGVELAVTIAALPVTVLVGWLMTRHIEEPCMALGRRWRWSERKREPRRSSAPRALAAGCARA